MTATRLSHIDSDQDRFACFAVMRELRPHLASKEAFAQQCRRQAEQGYRLLAARRAERIVALAGYRLQENLLYGRFIYIDDLVTSADARNDGLGERLIEAVRDEAQGLGCAHLVLDTALGNALAQRFYFRQGLLAKGMHFSLALLPLRSSPLGESS